MSSLCCYPPLQVNHNFIKAVVPHLVPVLLQQLTKQEEGQEQDDTAWNLAMASGTCLGLLARTAQVSSQSISMSRQQATHPHRQPGRASNANKRTLPTKQPEYRKRRCKR